MKLQKILKIGNFLLTNCIKHYNNTKKKYCLNKVSILYIKDNDNENIKQESKYLNNFIKNSKNRVLVLSEVNNFINENMLLIGEDAFKLKMYSNFKILVRKKCDAFVHVNIYLSDYRFISLKFINTKNITSNEDFANCFNDEELIFYYVIASNNNNQTFYDYLVNFNIYYKYNNVVLCCKNKYDNEEVLVNYQLIIRSVYKDITDIPTISPVMLNLVYA